jgi:Tol biopolymer transport system component
MDPLKKRFAYWNVLVVLALVLPFMLGACGDQPNGISAPTEIVQAATDTPIVPTDTPPPTDTPVPSDTPVPTDTPDLVATQVAVAQAAAATLTAMAPTPTNTSTVTPVPTSTTEPTATPTEAASPTPEVTNAPKPTSKPKAGKILFTSNRVSWDDIFYMNEDGTNVKQLTKVGHCYDAHFSPDGKRIVYDHEGDIWAMSEDGTGQINLTNTSDTIEMFPVFSSDGKRIAYLYAWPGGFEIYTMKADGTDRKSITSEGFDWMPAWQPNGNKIAFSSARSGMFNIWTVNADGSDLKQVTTFGNFAALSPAWSADGRQIAMVRYAGNSWEIWAVNSDGSNPHKVTQIVGGDDGFIPDMGGWKKGKIIFGGYHGNWDVAVVPDTGGETSFLTNNPKDDKPSDWWLP